MKQKKCEKCKNCMLNNGIRKCGAEEDSVRIVMVDGEKTPEYMWCYGKLYE